MTTKKTVLLVGLTVIDAVNFCKSYPQEDTDSRILHQRVTKGGNAANSACVLAQHDDLTVELLTTMSNIEEEKFVLKELQKFSVRLQEHCIFSSVKLPYSCVIINGENGSRTILHHRDNDYEELTFEIFRKVDLSKYNWIHFEGRNLFEVEKMIDHVVKFRKENARSITISGEIEKPVRMKHLFDVMIPRVDVLFVSKDIAQAKGFNSSEECTRELSTYQDLKAKYIVCPWGEKGASGVEKTKDGWCNYTSPSKDIDIVISTLGAGDTFIGAVIAGLVRGNSLDVCIKYGCHISGLKCSQYGFENLVQKYV